MKYNAKYQYAVALKDKAESIGSVIKGDILKKKNLDINNSWVLLKDGIEGWTVDSNEFEYFKSMGEAKECQDRLIGNINPENIMIGDYIVWNHSSYPEKSPGEIDIVVKPLNSLGCLMLKIFNDFDTKRLTKDKEANWFPTYEEASRYSKIVEDSSKVRNRRRRSGPSQSVSQKDESSHNFEIGDKVKCIDVVTDFNDCNGTSNGYAKWRKMADINVGNILEIKSIEKAGIGFYGRSYVHSPSAFIKVNADKQDSNKPVQKFIKGQWYKSFIYPNTMAKFSHIENGEWIGSEWITDKDNYYKERFISNKFNLTYPISAEQVSPYLPKGHPDKIESFNNMKVGVWYKEISGRHTGALICYQENTDKCYGLNIRKEWTNSFSLKNENIKRQKWIPASDEEVRLALVSYAKKKYKLGNSIISTEKIDNAPDAYKLNLCSIYPSKEEGDNFGIRGGGTVLYANGIWADIISEPFIEYNPENVQEEEFNLITETGNPEEPTKFPNSGKLLYKTSEKKNKKSFKNTVKVKI